MTRGEETGGAERAVRPAPMPRDERGWRVALGGRVAEEVVYDKITTGAESDLQQLTQIARQMVGRWGMSDRVGPVTVLASEAAAPLLPGASETSDETQRLVDREVRRLIDEAHAVVTDLLSEHRDQLEQLTRALLTAETLDALDAYAAAGGLDGPRSAGRDHDGLVTPA